MPLCESLLFFFLGFVWLAQQKVTVVGGGGVQGSGKSMTQVRKPDSYG